MARRRFGDYKEDVTRGKYSIVNPKTYKGDSLVQAWLERRKLAGICEYMDTHGSKEEQPRFMSDILRFVVDRAYEQLVSAGLCREWEIIPAGEYLESKFRIELNPQERGKKNLNHNLILQERKAEERIRIGKVREFTLAEESKSGKDVGYVCNEVDVKEEDVIAAKAALAEVMRKVDYSKIVDNTSAVAPMKIHPRFQKDDNPNEIDWEKVRAANIQAQKENDDRIRNEKLKEKIKEKLIKQQVKIEIEKAKLNEAECTLKSKLEEIDQGYAPTKMGKISEQIRSKTEYELLADAKRIEEKDKELLKNLDYIPPLSGENS